jgi:hypothetical protein
MEFRTQEAAGSLASLPYGRGSVYARFARRVPGIVCSTEPRSSASGQGTLVVAVPGGLGPRSRAASVSKWSSAIMVLLAFYPAVLPAAEYRARHDHAINTCTGTLTIDERGVSYREDAAEKRKHPHNWTWAYQDIQQLELAPAKLHVLTYRDNKWKLGADREYTFHALGGEDFSSAYALLKDRLDQRFVAELADAAVEPVWEIPVKHRGRIGGSEELLIVGEDRIVYKTARKSDARTWRYGDVDNVSTSGPFDLTLTTFERARSHYGSRKDFNFQLKAPLDERKYNELWRKLNLRSNK